jgi:hypothetical protein
MEVIEIVTGEQQVVTANDHFIGSLCGPASGPTLIFVASIHGNEPAGTIAARQVLSELQSLSHLLRGEVVFLTGNTRALARGVRYIDADLNRHWTAEKLTSSQPGNGPSPICSEDLERRELLDAITPVLARANGEVYFLDMHTTSAGGVPFATVGDTLRNRKFALHFPATILLGIEEQLDGTLLEYVNNLGAVTMGFEAGQHASQEAVENDVAVIWIALVAARCLRREDVPDLDRHHARLERASGGSRIVEIRHRHATQLDDCFEMEPGFENFQPVRRGQLLARNRRGPITACESGMIIMPRYQSLGDDGFFLGREVKPFWLKLSSILRGLRLGDFMYFLPGVVRHPVDASTLIVNTRVARLFPLQIFHLLGFRKRRWKNDLLEVSRRR